MQCAIVAVREWDNDFAFYFSGFPNLINKVCFSLIKKNNSKINKKKKIFSHDVK